MVGVGARNTVLTSGGVCQFLADFVCKPNSETSLQANKQRPLCRLMAAARMVIFNHYVIHKL